MTCAQFDLQFDAYLAGTLSEADALALEAHASECARCEARMNDGTRVAFAIPEVALPNELRAPTLGAIAPRRSGRRAGYWVTGVAAFAAAVVAFVLMNARESTAPQLTIPAKQVPTVAVQAPTIAVPRAASVDTLPVAAPKNVVVTKAVSPPTSKPTSTPPKYFANAKDRIVYEHSSAEFVALDTAAHELERALVKSPDDAQLRAFLETVRTRRSELERRVKDASL